MTARKKIQLCCDPDVRDILCTAIREYAHAAYPVGGTECAQVARYTLLELAAEIEAGITGENELIEVSKRPRVMVRAALEYYFNRSDETRDLTSVHQRALFDSLLRGQAVKRSDLELALAADGQH